MNKEEKKFLKDMVKLLPDKCEVVEIGSWTGGSSEVLAKALVGKGGLTCVDLWDYHEGHCHPSLHKMALKLGGDIFSLFKDRVKGYNVISIKGRSDDVSDGFEDDSLDMVFLDGDHSYEGVKSDIEHWLPKIKQGGVMCGHDYGREEYGVTEAVNEKFTVVELPARSMWKVVV